MKNKIYELVGKILCKKLGEEHIIVMKLFPLEYMMLTQKGKMYLQYLEENGTEEGFKEMYDNMFKK